MELQTAHILHLEYDENESATEFFAKTTDLLQSIDDLSNAIIHCFGVDIQTKITIINIENGSLKAFVKDVIVSLDEDKIRRYVEDPKEALIDFLITARKKLLKVLSKGEDIPKEVPIALEQSIEKSPLKNYGYYPKKIEVLKALSKITDKSKEFKMPPVFILKDEQIELSGTYAFNYENIEGIEKQTSSKKGAFTIKKPDLAGTSKWTIIDGKAIEVKIQDEKWLQALKNHEIVLGCGDKIEGTLITQSYIITSGLEVAEVNYFLDNITGVIPPKQTKRLSLWGGKDNNE